MNRIGSLGRGGFSSVRHLLAGLACALPFTLAKGADPLSPPAAVLRIPVPPYARVQAGVSVDPFDASLNVLLFGQLTGATNAEAADTLSLWDHDALALIAAFRASGGVAGLVDGAWYADLASAIPSGLQLPWGTGFEISSRHDATQEVWLAGLLPGAPTATLLAPAGPSLLAAPYPATLFFPQDSPTGDYDANPPAAVPSLDLAHAKSYFTDHGDPAVTDPLKPGRIRIWTKDASQHRNPSTILAGGDFIGPGQHYCYTSLITNGSSAILYVEGIGCSPNWGIDKIRVELYSQSSGNHCAADEISYTVVRCVYKICNWRPYVCDRDSCGTVTNRRVYRADYDSPRALYQSYMYGQVHFDDYTDLTGQHSHGMSAFMGHTFARIEVRTPDHFQPDSFWKLPGTQCQRLQYWTDQTGENTSLETLNAYLSVQSGTVWWFRAHDGCSDDQKYLQDKYDYYYLNPQAINNLSDTNRILKQVAVHEFRITPETGSLLDHYAKSIHDFDGYGLDTDQRDEWKHMGGIYGVNRAGCGSYVGMLSQYAGVCDITRWLFDHPMPQFELTNVRKHSEWWISLGSAISDYKKGTDGELMTKLTMLASNAAVDLDMASGQEHALENWQVESPRFTLRKLMYCDPGLISDWIDETNAFTSYWSKDSGVTIIYEKTMKGNIDAWKHNDPVLFVNGGYQ